MQPGFLILFCNHCARIYSKIKGKTVPRLLSFKTAHISTVFKTPISPELTLWFLGKAHFPRNPSMVIYHRLSMDSEFPLDSTV